MKSFQGYKTSEVDWLGDVPEHWTVQKLRHILSDVTERNRPDMPLLSVVREQGVILRDVDDKEENHNFIPDDLSNYKVVHSGQFAMNKMKAWQGSFGVSEYNGIVSPAYFVFDVRSVHQSFFHAAIRSKAYVPFFSQASDGVRIAQWDLSKVRMREIPFFTPPLNEQAAIVRYLDHADERIRRAISAKERLIELLTEQRQAVIHRAVTRGLDPNVPLKDSGVEWLGDVPKHWEVAQLGRIGKFMKCSGGTKADEEQEGIPCVRYGDLYTFYGAFIERNRSFIAAERAIGYTQIKYGDILFAGSGETIDDIGKSAVNLIESEVRCGGDVILFRPKLQMNAKYSGYLLDSSQSREQKSRMGRGFTIMHIYGNDLKYLWLSIPPLREQSTIARYLDKATSDIDTTIDKTQRQIDLLREYRTRLIADVVTGQVDVREA